MGPGVRVDEAAVREGEILAGAGDAAEAGAEEPAAAPA